MHKQQTNSNEVIFRRKIITTRSKFLSLPHEIGMKGHQDQGEWDLRPSLTLRSTFPIILTESKELKINKNLSERRLFIPFKQNIDYSALFEKKIVGLKGSKANYFLTKIKTHKKTKSPEPTETKQSIKLPPSKYFQKKRQTLREQIIDICQETLKMAKGLTEKDFDAFILLLNQSEQHRKRKSVMRWQHFSIEKFHQIYTQQSTQ